jgi:TatD DNase family protein
MMIDAHCHAHQAANELGPPENQPQLAVINSTRENDWRAVLRFCQHNPQQRVASLGLHPWYLDEAKPDWLHSLGNLLEESDAAIGECGLDRSVGHRIPITRQRELLLAHLQLAKEKNRIVSLHCVGAWGHLLDCLDQAGSLPRPFVLHSISCPPELLSEFLSRGALCSVSYRTPDALIELIPDQYLVIETDYPAHNDTALSWAGQLQLQHDRLAAMAKRPLGEAALVAHLRSASGCQ